MKDASRRWAWKSNPSNPPSAKHYAYWLLLSALPSGFLLTVTNFIALEVGSFPLVWVTPLALYLCSFVVTFRSRGGVPRFLSILWPEVVILGFLLYLFPCNGQAGLSRSSLPCCCSWRFAWWRTANFTSGVPRCASSQITI